MQTLRLSGLLTLLFAVALSGQASAQVPFETIANPSEWYRPAGTIEVIRSSGAFGELWRQLHTRGTPPLVDFRKRMVVAYFSGPHPDKGNFVDVEEVSIRAGSMVLRIAAKDHCGGGQMPTAKAVVISTVKWPGSVVADQHMEPCL